MDICGQIVTVLLLVALTWQEAYSLICHVCNSAPDRDGVACDDPFTNTSFLHDCSSYNPNATSCRKIKQNVLGEYRVIRQCANVPAPIECVGRIGTKYVRVQHCHCADSFCNNANPTHLNLSTGLTLIIATFLNPWR